MRGGVVLIRNLFVANCYEQAVLAFQLRWHELFILPTSFLQSVHIRWHTINVYASQSNELSKPNETQLRPSYALALLGRKRKCNANCMPIASGGQ